jgi:hypothetical protein
MIEPKKFKFSKTSTFLFPLLEIPKQLFHCSIKTKDGYTNTRFLDSYMWDSELEFDFNNEPYVFIAVKQYQDSNFETFYSTITSFENYIDEYHKGDFYIMIFKIPDSNIDAYNTILEGEYSKLEANYKSLIMKNFFFTGKPTTIPLILNKAYSLKEAWENMLGCDNSVVNLGDQEVWSRILKENEGLSTEKLQTLSTNRSLVPTTDFDY